MTIAPFLLIGLGNPGSAYADNRHNIGFMVIDRVMKEYGFSKPVSKFSGSLSQGTIGGHKAYALKPLSFMNLSGGPAGEVTRFYKIPPEHTIVIHDELDLPLGKLRVKYGGSNGGHNGLKSLDAHLGPDYWRIRIGISHPGDKDLVSDHVLSDFQKSEQASVDSMIKAIGHHIGILLDGDDAGFMNKIALACKS